MDIFDFIENYFVNLLDRFVQQPVRQEISMTTQNKFSITLEQLCKIMPLLPKAKANMYYPHLVGAMEEFEINTAQRAAAFLAQIAHESAQLRYFEEIADGSAYENRKDLGNVLPGDGKRFKGRGPIQLTGRANYRDYGKELGIDLENSPELASSPEIGFRTAGAFWKRKGLNDLADNGEFRKISVRINGINKKTGEPNGLADRIKYYTVAKSILSVK